MMMSVFAGIVLYDYFFFNDPATTEIYTLSLHDALPISSRPKLPPSPACGLRPATAMRGRDRKSTRLNSSHVKTSYAVFGLKKKTKSTVAPRGRKGRALPHERQAAAAEV